MATNFLYGAGTSNNGLLTSVLTLLTTELNSLASAALIISSVVGTSGLFTNSNTGQGIYADLFFNLGAVTAMTAGGNLAVWFLTSPDGSTFESTTVVPPRAPDAIVPLDATTGSKVYAAKRVILPALNFKVLVQNNSGQAFTASANTLKAAIYSVQY